MTIQETTPFKPTPRPWIKEGDKIAVYDTLQPSQPSYYATVLSNRLSHQFARILKDGETTAHLNTLETAIVVEHDGEEQRSSINFKHFLPISVDTDYRIYERRLHGIITDVRMAALYRFARKNTFSSRDCGHAHDCCGCMSQQVKVSYWRVAYKTIGAQIIITQSFNY